MFDRYGGQRQRCVQVQGAGYGRKGFPCLCEGGNVFQLLMGPPEHGRRSYRPVSGCSEERIKEVWWRRRESNLSSPFRICNLLILQREESAKRPTQARLSYNYRTILPVEKPPTAPKNIEPTSRRDRKPPVRYFHNLRQSRIEAVAIRCARNGKLD